MIEEERGRERGGEVRRGGGFIASIFTTH